MSVSRGIGQMTGTMPRQRGIAPAEGAAHHDGQNPPGQVPVRDLVGDEVLDALLERSKEAAGGLRLTGEGSMLGDLVKAVLERALETELTAHLGYAKHDAAVIVQDLMCLPSRSPAVSSFCVLRSGWVFLPAWALALCQGVTGGSPAARRSRLRGVRS